jgi:2-iminobutanoate/2-iminopropanoate deaminase
MSRCQQVEVPSINPPISHYAHAVRVDSLVFISGCAPVDATGELVGEHDFETQARQVFHNMQQILDAVGATFADIAKITIYLTDLADRDALTPIRQQVFGTARPASTLVEVSRIATNNIKIEIDAIVAPPA